MDLLKLQNTVASSLTWSSSFLSAGISAFSSPNFKYFSSRSERYSVMVVLMVLMIVVMVPVT